MSLNSFNNSTSSDFYFSVKFALIEMGLDSCEPDPRSTSSNSSSATTCASFSVITSSSFYSSIFKLSWAMQHAKLPCWHSWVGPARISLVGPTYLHNMYTILPSGPQTLMHWGVSSDSAMDTSLLFLFLANNSLRSGSGSSWMSSHLGTKVPHGFDTELSPDGAYWW